MLWKKTWDIEAVLALLGGIVAAFLAGNLAAGLLRQSGVHGFKTDDSIGCVLLATLSFHGSAIILGTYFLKIQQTSWREVLGPASWKRCFLLAATVLMVVTPFMFALKFVSELILAKIHWGVENEKAVDMILAAKPWICAYLVFFAVVLAPIAEEFVFRGLLFSTAKRFGWPKLGWIGVSLLFALVHFNAPTFLPLFLLALALTWLYNKTESLLAPILAHSLFNSANVVLLLLQEPLLRHLGQHP